RNSLAGGAVLGADRRGPVVARPAARSQGLVARGRVRLVPVDPLPTRLLAERGLPIPVPRVRRRDSERPPAAALVVQVADVVVRLVRLPDPGVGVGGRAVLRSEAPYVHVPQVEAGFAPGDPLGDHPSDPPGPRQAAG